MDKLTDFLKENSTKPVWFVLPGGILCGKLLFDEALGLITVLEPSFLSGGRLVPLSGVASIVRSQISGWGDGALKVN